MPDQLVLPDIDDARDLATFTGRAARIDEAGAIRLQTHGETGIATVCVLQGANLLDPTPTVLGMRTFRILPAAPLDRTVLLRGMLDRFHREIAPTVPLPPDDAHASWAGISPPRGGWQRTGSFDAVGMREIAEAGVAEMREGHPGAAAGGSLESLIGIGQSRVTRARGEVWGRAIATSETADPTAVPAGAAFALDALGFLAPENEEIPVFAAEGWQRLSTPRGHVLVRGSVR